MLCEETIISLERDALTNKTQVHVLGYGYYVGEPKHLPYRFLEYCGYYIPLDYIMENGFPDDGDYEGYDYAKQYIQDCSYRQMKHIYQHYDNGNPPTSLKLSELCSNTPYGVYKLTK